VETLDNLLPVKHLMHSLRWFLQWGISLANVQQYNSYTEV